MITLSVDRSGDGRIVHFCMEGHADSGPHGYDLVCAAASAVSFGALNAIECLSGVKMAVHGAKEGGFLDCTFPQTASPESRDKAQLILEAMLVALRTIEHSYSAYIQIIDKGGADDAET